jgi:hypothetical protein
MINVCELIYKPTNVLNKTYDKYLSPTCFGTRMPSSGILADPLTWRIPWGWHPGAETCRRFVINCTLLSTPVGLCINYYNMHSLNNINVRCEFIVNLLLQLQQCTARHVILGAFSKLCKATISLVMYVRLFDRPSVRMEQLDSHWTNFHKIWYSIIFRNFVEKFKFH